MNYFQGINERIRFIIKKRNLNTRQLNIRLGYVPDNKQAFLKGNKLLPSTEFLGRFFTAFPDEDPIWVLFGEKTEAPEPAQLIKIIASQQETIKELSKGAKTVQKNGLV